MKKVLTLMAVISLMTVGTASAQFNWQLNDFGSSVFDHNNNWSPVDYSQLYPNMLPNVPSPGNLGEGGEKFDLEGFFYAKKGNTINIALTNSFGMGAYSTSWRNTYPLGDIFFGFNGNSYQYAIDVSAGTIVEVQSYYTVNDNPYNLRGTYAGTSLADDIGGTFIRRGTVLGNLSDFAHSTYNFGGIENGTHIMEFAFDASLIAGFAGRNSVSFHNTLGCGNDVINENYPAIPEPSTLFLLGTGILGLGWYRRRAH